MDDLDPHDPYAPPEAALFESSPTSETTLASRGTRLIASLIDSFVGVPPVVWAMWYLGMLDGFPNLEPPSTSAQLALGVFGLLTFLAMHGYLMHAYGQTVGKSVMKIRMVRQDGSAASFGRLLGLRYLPIWIVTSLPVVGQILPILDILFIFGESRRCLHDWIAGTIVVTA